MEEASDQSFLSRFKSLFRKAKPRDEEAELTEEIYDLMDEGQAKGLISGEVSEMVHAVLDLKETKAYEIMVPRTQVISAPVSSMLAWRSFIARRTTSSTLIGAIEKDCVPTRE